MIRRCIAAAVLLLSSVIALAQMPGKRREVPASVPPDAVSVDAIVAAFYASVSHAPDAMPDFERMRGLMRQPVIFDGRNVYDPKRTRERGFTYFGVGRGS